MGLFIYGVIVLISLQTTWGTNQNFFYFHRTNHPSILTMAEQQASVAHLDILSSSPNYQRIQVRSAEFDNDPFPTTFHPINIPTLSSQTVLQIPQQNSIQEIFPSRPPNSYFHDFPPPLAFQQQPASAYENLVSQQPIENYPNPSLTFQSTEHKFNQLVDSQSIPLHHQRSTISDVQGIFEVRQPAVTGYAYSIGSNDKIVATSSFTLGSSKHDPSFSRFKFLGQRPFENFNNPYSSHLFQRKHTKQENTAKTVQGIPASAIETIQHVPEAIATEKSLDVQKNITDNENNRDAEEKKITKEVNETISVGVTEKVADTAKENISHPEEIITEDKDSNNFAKANVPEVDGTTVSEIVEKVLANDVKKMVQETVGVKFSEIGETKVPKVEENAPEDVEEKLAEISEENLPKVIEEKVAEATKAKAQEVAKEKVLEVAEDKVVDKMIQVAVEQMAQEVLEKMVPNISEGKVPEPVRQMDSVAEDAKVRETVENISPKVKVSKIEDSEESTPPEHVIGPDSGRVRGIPLIDTNETVITKPVGEVVQGVIHLEIKGSADPVKDVEVSLNVTDEPSLNTEKPQTEDVAVTDTIENEGETIAKLIQPDAEILSQSLKSVQNSLIPNEEVNQDTMEENIDRGGLPPGLEDDQYKILQGILDTVSKGSQPEETDFASEELDGYEVEERSYNVKSPNAFQNLPDKEALPKARRISQTTFSTTLPPIIEEFPTSTVLTTLQTTSEVFTEFTPSSKIIEPAHVQPKNPTYRYGTGQSGYLPSPETNALKILHSRRLKKVDVSRLITRPTNLVLEKLPLEDTVINRKINHTKRPRVRVVIKTKVRNQNQKNKNIFPTFTTLN